MTEWADVFECSCGFAYEGENRVEVERAHLYVNKFVDDCNEAELREQIAREIERSPKFKVTDQGMVEDGFGYYFYVKETLESIRGK